jgi:hypothetical protein
MNAFDTAAVLIAIAALSGYINHRVLKLSATTGTLAVALVSSFVVVAADAAVPGWRLGEALAGFLGEIDFNEALMHGMLCFLLSPVHCTSISKACSSTSGPSACSPRSACCCRHWSWAR